MLGSALHTVIAVSIESQSRLHGQHGFMLYILLVVSPLYCTRIIVCYIVRCQSDDGNTCL